MDPRDLSVCFACGAAVVDGLAHRTFHLELERRLKALEKRVDVATMGAQSALEAVDDDHFTREYAP